MKKNKNFKLSLNKKRVSSLDQKLLLGGDGVPVHSIVLGCTAFCNISAICTANSILCQNLPSEFGGGCTHEPIK